MSANSNNSAQISLANLPIIRWIFSSIGKKTVVAVTGFLLVAFLVGHLMGNFTLYFGQDAINTYAEKLQSLGPLLWLVRLAILTIFLSHIWFTVLLILDSRAASGSKYICKNNMGSTIFVRTMKYTGLIVFAFIVFHLAHLTLGYVQPEYFHLKDSLGRHDVYSMVIHGFKNVPISIFYILALTLLASHLSHGISSLLQTFGLSNKKLHPLIENAGAIIAWALWLGYVSLPISVLLGFVKLPA